MAKRGRPAGQVSMGPLELIGLLRHCDYLIRTHDKPLTSDRDRGRMLEAHFNKAGAPYVLKTRVADDYLGSDDIKGETLRKQLRKARAIRNAHPRAWGCLTSALSDMDTAENRAQAEERGVDEHDLVFVNMAMFVVCGIVEESAVEQLFSALDTAYHADYYFNAWQRIATNIKTTAGCNQLKEIKLDNR